MIALPAPERYDAILLRAPLPPTPQGGERGEAITRVKTLVVGAESHDRVESFNRAITGWLSPNRTHSACAIAHIRMRGLAATAPGR